MQGPMERGQNAEVRGQEEPNSQQPFNAKGARGAKGTQAGGEGRSAALSTPAQGRWMGLEGAGGEDTEREGWFFPAT